MKKPKDHKVLPKSFSLIQVTQLNLKFLADIDLNIQEVVRIENSLLWKSYLRGCRILEQKNDKKPVEKWMFHLTSNENAMEISKNGFSINKSSMKDSVRKQHRLKA